MSTLISVQEYHRLKSYYPRRTYESKKLEYHMCASPDIGKLHLTLVIDAMIA